MSIYKIAQITGYSASTVARALRNEGYCHEDTKKVILQAASEMGYRPNIAAKTLRNNKTQRVLFCIPDICNPFYFPMIQGASKVLESSGYYVMLINTEHSLDKEIETIRLFQEGYCDGMIFVSFDFNDKNIEEVNKVGVPTVLTNRYSIQPPDANFDYVYVDHVLGMKKATEHLISKGCKKILLVSGTLSEQTSKERAEGYFSALKENGIIVDKNLIINGNYSTEGAYNAIAQFSNNDNNYDGVIASNDLAALGILKYFKEKGIKVPQDKLLASFDNTDYASIISPQLTSVDMRQYDIGVQSATLLLERLNGRKEVKNINLEPNFIVRESS